MYEKFIAEVVPLESCCNVGEVIRCSEDGNIIEYVNVFNSNHGVIYAEGRYDLSFPVESGKYFALKFIDITNRI